MTSLRGMFQSAHIDHASLVPKNQSVRNLILVSFWFGKGLLIFNMVAWPFLWCLLSTSNKDCHESVIWSIITIETILGGLIILAFQIPLTSGRASTNVSTLYLVVGVLDFIAYGCMSYAGAYVFSESRCPTLFRDVPVGLCAIGSITYLLNALLFSLLLGEWRLEEEENTFQ